MTDVDARVCWRILVVEDDERISGNLARSLRAEGYEVDCAPTLGDAREILRDGDPLRREVSLVLLDVGLPDGNGIEFCRELRQTRSNLGVILLTARTEEIDVVVGFEAGAVDYVTKPFRLGELLARIRSRLRHQSTVDEPDAPIEPEVSERYATGDVVVDPAQRRVFVDGHEVTLRAKEFDLLAALTAKPGAVLRREELMRDVWDENWWGSTKTLDVHVRALRQRLGETSPVGSRIVALRGIGYRFEPRT